MCAIIILLLISPSVIAELIKVPLAHKEVKSKVELTRDGTSFSIIDSGYIQEFRQNQTFFLESDLPNNENYYDFRIIDMISGKQFIKMHDIFRSAPNCNGQFSFYENDTRFMRPTIVACFTPQSDEFSFETQTMIANEAGDMFDELRKNSTYVQMLNLGVRGKQGGFDYEVITELAPDLFGLTEIHCPNNSKTIPLGNGYSCKFNLGTNDQMNLTFKLIGTDRHLMERAQDYQFQANLQQIASRVSLLTAFFGAIVGAMLTYFMTLFLDWAKKSSKQRNIRMHLFQKIDLVHDDVKGWLEDLEENNKQFCAYPINSLNPAFFSAAADYGIRHATFVRIYSLINLLYKIEDKIVLANNYNATLKGNTISTTDRNIVRNALITLLKSDLQPRLEALEKFNSPEQFKKEMKRLKQLGFI